MFIANTSLALTAFKLAKNNGKPLIFPTDTIYGIGSVISDLKGNNEIFRIKNRPLHQKLPLLVSNIEKLKDIAEVGKHEDFILNNYQHPYTFILKAKSCLNDFYKSIDTVAIRVVDAGWLHNVLVELDEPITATSVNVTGEKLLNDFKSVFDKFSESVSIFINDKPKLDTQSSIFCLSENEIVKVR